MGENSRAFKKPLILLAIAILAVAVVLWGPTSPALGLIGLVAILILWENLSPKAVANFEESVLALLLAAMTLVSFGQVVARYGFNTGWTGALEFTRILFAWMILFGMSYGVKTSSHLGVDAVIQLLPRPVFRGLAVFGALCGVAYGLLLLDGSWLQHFGINTRGGAIDYWSKMYKIGIGLDDLRYPEFVQELFGTRERVQRWIAYLILPVGLSLFTYRCLQAAWHIVQGERHMLIAAHEAEDLVAENLNVAGEDAKVAPSQQHQNKT